MHKLIFNGCSFVHGFDAAWDYERNPRISEEVRTLGSSYWYELQKVNLSGRVAELLGIKSVRNLARNGNSNDIILFETMQYIESLSPDIKPIVMIGWTEPARMLVFDERAENAAMSINPFVVDNWIKKASSFYDEERSKYLTDFYSRFAEPSRHIIRFFTRDLMASNLIRSALCLQNYLEKKQIPYVFWNSLDGIRLPRNSIISGMIPIMRMENWLSIDAGPDQIPIETGWRKRIGITQRTQTAHPNGEAISQFAQLVTDFVRRKDWFDA